jgi:UDP-N-acetylmuramoyl-tripeptide--D-alanyl-D-alanine ligase
MLRDIVEPNVAVVTSIAEEHLEGFGSIEGVLREEGAAVDGVACAVVPVHEHALEAIARETAKRVVTAGLDAGDLHASSWRLADDGSGIAVVAGIAVHSPLRGVHNVRNMLLALATARELGVSIADAARGIARMTPPSMRSAWERIGDALVINDAYNSNPGSALAALEMLAAAPGSAKVAILGTMRELGDSAERCHDDVARAAIASDATVIAGLGDFAAAFARVAPGDPRIVTAADVDELWEALAPRLPRAATILLKASRGVRLERIVPHLTSWATTFTDSRTDSRSPSAC